MRRNENTRVMTDAINRRTDEIENCHDRNFDYNAEPINQAATDRDEPYSNMPNALHIDINVPQQHDSQPEPRRISFPVRTCPLTKKSYVSSITSTHEPQSYHEAVQHNELKEAMQYEIDALIQNNTSALIDFPKGKSPIGCRWVYKVKHKADGTIERYKSQGWDIQQLDINNAFLHGDLNDEVYMVLPQASRQWNVKLTKALQAQGTDPDQIKGLKHMLDTSFKIKDIGNLNYFLGIEAFRNLNGISSRLNNTEGTLLDNPEIFRSEAKGARRVVKLVSIPSNKQLADGFTKNFLSFLNVMLHSSSNSNKKLSQTPLLYKNPRGHITWHTRKSMAHNCISMEIYFNNIEHYNDEHSLEKTSAQQA
ncbi:PREDICTED: uncharacterized protein LOC109171716 [Ipomoea nil]|uniref:uncharacterized protein LOC109171716 n=1 Tax=Ipomoea nil TaxID=35883 RepID=UPI000901944E|nr:PREDICTED: uncharacterized protein LOC109171716 [Ipomoea nil]